MLYGRALSALSRRLSWRMDVCPRSTDTIYIPPPTLSLAAQLAVILDDPSSSPDDVAWALEQQRGAR